jgi:transposase
LIDSCLKERIATGNEIYGEVVLGIPSKYVYRSLTCVRKYLNKEVSRIETKQLSLFKQEEQVQLTLLQSIPKIGLKTALFLIVVSDGLEKFENLKKKLFSYVRITQKIRKSGSSVRGRSRIRKVGNRKLRNLLFLCSFKACREVY